MNINLILTAAMGIINLSQIDSIIPQIYHQYDNIYDRISFYSGEFLGTSYVLGPLGEGEGNFPDDDPRFDFERVDCMTFCEQVIALSLSRENFQEFLEILDHIRYADGQVSYYHRNHYTVTDWIIHNHWLCSDVTPDIPGVKKIFKQIDRQSFLIEHDYYPDMNLPVANVECFYFPKQNIQQLNNYLANADLVMLVTNKPGIVVAHWGFYICPPGIFRHASMSNRQVVDLAWDNFINYLQSKQNLLGVMVVRIKTSPDLYWREDD